MNDWCEWCTRSANVNSVDNFYWTPLHMAAHSGVRSVVEYLIDHGASLEAKSLTGATPIMKAIETCSLDVVQMMINRGAKVRAEDRCCKSPALLLTRSTQPSHLSLGESNKCQRWLGFLQEFSCSVFSTFALVPSDIFQFCILLLCISCVLCRKLGLQSHVLISHI